jgi:predicted nucleotidyltransferase
MANISDRKQIEDIVRRYAELVMKEMSVDMVYIFGSHIKGTNNVDSDIDVAIVGNDFLGDPFNDTFRLMRIRRKVDKRIEPHPIKTSDFGVSNPFYKEIIETGVRIM